MRAQAEDPKDLDHPVQDTGSIALRNFMLAQSLSTYRRYCYGFLVGDDILDNSYLKRSLCDYI